MQKLNFYSASGSATNTSRLPVVDSSTVKYFEHRTHRTTSDFKSSILIGENDVRQLGIFRTMENLEEQCEDAVFELCDAREQFPSLCVNELKKCIQIKNDINMSKVLRKPAVVPDESPTSREEKRLDFDIDEDEIRFDRLDSKLKNVISTLDNLKGVVEQIEREKQCSTNKLLEN